MPGRCLTHPVSMYVSTAGNPKQKLIYGKLWISNDTGGRQGSQPPPHSSPNLLSSGIETGLHSGSVSHQIIAPYLKSVLIFFCKI